MKIIFVIVGLLAILLVGFVSFSAVRNWQEKRQNTALTTHKSKEVNKKKQSFSKKNRVKSQSSSSSSFTKSTKNNNRETDPMIDQFTDAIESSEINDSPAEKETSEKKQAIITKSYDDRYDMLVEICQQMEPIQDKIENIQDDIKYKFDMLKSNVNDIHNPTEDEEISIQEWTEKCQTLYDKQKKLLGEYIVFFDKIEQLVPGAAKSQPSSDETQTVTYIDYSYIKSTLGPVPEDIDSYLSQVFSDAKIVSVIYEVELKQTNNDEDLIDKL